MGIRRSINIAVALVTAFLMALLAAPAHAAATPSVTAGTVTYSNECDGYSPFDIGCQLTVDTSGWAAGASPVTLTYKWLRNGVAISSATAATYRIQAADHYKNITVAVTGKATGYKAATVASQPVKTLSGKVCTIVGTANNDTLIGTAKADVICGVGGYDRITPKAGNDTIDGGTFGGLVDYSADKAAMTVALPTDLTTSNGSAKSAATGTDKLIRIKNVITGSGNDVIAGGTIDNMIYAGAGNDTVRAGDGSDVVNGGAGNDTIYGDGGDDRVSGLAGADKLYGGEGDDLCDNATAYADAIDSCTISTLKPVLISSQVRMTGGIIRVEDGMGLLQSVEVYMTPDGDISGGWESLKPFATIGFGTSIDVAFDWSNLKNLTWGRRYITIVASTLDGRYESWRGQADDTFTKGSDSTTANVNIPGVGNRAAYIDFAWDVTAPVFTSIVSSAQSVDTSTESKDITFTLRYTGDETPVFTICELVFLDSSAFRPYLSTESYGGNTCTFTLPAGSPAGDYGLKVEAADASGNRVRIAARTSSTYYDTNKVVHDIGPSTLGLVVSQTGVATAVPANMGPVTFSNSTVSTQIAAKKVTATFDVLDVDLLNVSYMGCELINPQSQGIYVSADPRVTTGNRVRAEFTLPKGAPKGKYMLKCSFGTDAGWYSDFIGQGDGTFTFVGPSTSTVSDAVAHPSYFTVV